MADKSMRAIDFPAYLLRNSSTASDRSPESSPSLPDHAKRTMDSPSASLSSNACSSVIICRRLVGMVSFPHEVELVLERIHELPYDLLRVIGSQFRHMLFGQRRQMG